MGNSRTECCLGSSVLDDAVCGDPGSDFIYGGADSDTLYAYDTYSDTLVGGNGTGIDVCKKDKIDIRFECEQ